MATFSTHSPDFGDCECHGLLIVETTGVATTLGELIQHGDAPKPEVASKCLVEQLVLGDTVVSRGAAKRIEQALVHVDRHWIDAGPGHLELAAT